MLVILAKIMYFIMVSFKRMLYTTNFKIAIENIFRKKKKIQFLVGIFIKSQHCVNSTRLKCIWHPKPNFH